MVNNKVAEMKWVNQNLTDERLNAWFIEHQNSIYRLLQKPNLEDLKRAVYSAQIMYYYYFRLLIFNDETRADFDKRVDNLRRKVEQLETMYDGTETIEINEDIIKAVMELVSEMSILLQKGRYFFNVMISTKDFEETLQNLKNL